MSFFFPSFIGWPLAGLLNLEQPSGIFPLPVFLFLSPPLRMFAWSATILRRRLGPTLSISLHTHVIKTEEERIMTKIPIKSQIFPSVQKETKNFQKRSTKTPLSVGRISSNPSSLWSSALLLSCTILGTIPFPEQDSEAAQSENSRLVLSSVPVSIPDLRTCRLQWKEMFPKILGIPILERI